MNGEKISKWWVPFLVTFTVFVGIPFGSYISNVSFSPLAAFITWGVGIFIFGPYLEKRLNNLRKKE